MNKCYSLMNSSLEKRSFLIESVSLKSFSNFGNFYEILKTKEEILIALKELQIYKKELKNKLLQIYSFAKYMQIQTEDNNNFFLMIGNMKLSVLSLGVLPYKEDFPNLTENFDFYGKDFICPVGLKVKRRYSKYIGCKRKTDTIFYTFEVTEDGPIVISEDKKKTWKGKNYLEDMNKSFDDAYKIKDAIELHF